MFFFPVTNDFQPVTILEKVTRETFTYPWHHGKCLPVTPVTNYSQSYPWHPWQNKKILFQHSRFFSMYLFVFPDITIILVPVTRKGLPVTLPKNLTRDNFFHPWQFAKNLPVTSVTKSKNCVSRVTFGVTGKKNTGLRRATNSEVKPTRGDLPTMGD